MSHLIMHTLAIFEPPRSQKPKGSLVIVTKRGKKEDDDQHEDRDQEGHKKL